MPGCKQSCQWPQWITLGLQIHNVRLVVGGIFLLDQSVVRGYKVIVLGGTFTLLLRIFWVRDTMFSCWGGPIIHLVNLLSISWVMSYCLGGGYHLVQDQFVCLWAGALHFRDSCKKNHRNADKLYWYLPHKRLQLWRILQMHKNWDLVGLHGKFQIMLLQ